MSKIIGINAYHGDSSACIVINNEIVAAAEEERFNRIKHWAGLPVEAINYCLNEANIKYTDLDYVAINSDPKSSLHRKLLYILSKKPSFSFLKNRIKNQLKRKDIIGDLNQYFGSALGNEKLVHIDHHLCHLASAFYISPYEESIVLSVDGFGDFASTAWGYGSGNKIDIHGKIYFPHSLGIFYQALTQYLGFKNYGDEYKVMGLAPYGEPGYVDVLRKVLIPQHDGMYKLDLQYFRHTSEHIPYSWQNGVPVIGDLFSDKLEKLLGKARDKDDELTQYHKDIARSTQVLYEESFLNLINMLEKKYKSKNISLAGGCAMNSVANGKIYDGSQLQNVYIQSAAGDAGGAIGAALATDYRVNSKSKRNKVMHSYFGSSYRNEQIEKIIEDTPELSGSEISIRKYDDEEELCSHVAKRLSESSVIGWFQGRMEWGPRALGNRSILCDPRNPDVRDLLNIKIKRRETFRPFAPSILREHVNEYFEKDDDVPFMMKVFKIRADKRSTIPAVTHHDGTGRLQTVYKETNARYYNLISAFNVLTGVPILLNTSFNENEPIVRTPEEALSCFLRTKMDVLVLEDYVIERTE